MSNKPDILILGSGAAGYTAGIYAARAGLKVKILAGEQLGGQLTLTHEVENFPGFEKVSGFELLEKMQKQTESFGVELEFESAVQADLKEGALKIETDMGTVYEPKALIIATGASAKWLDIPSEKEFIGRGVSACAVCDGPFYKGKTVAVIGGGNSAVDEAHYLSGLADKVYLVHRRNELRAEKIRQDRLFANKKIEPVWDSVVEEITGSQNVAGIKVKNVKTGDVKEIKVDGVFVSIGFTPNAHVFKGQIELDNAGYIKTKGKTGQTSVPGVFAAGDVMSPDYRQAVIAAGAGAIAAMDAIHYIVSLEGKKA